MCSEASEESCGVYGVHRPQEVARLGACKNPQDADNPCGM